MANSNTESGREHYLCSTTRGEIPLDIEQKIEPIDPEIKDWIRRFTGTDA